MIELLEHNVETYQNLCKEMGKHNKVALIQATGTGKSYIISKYIEEHCHNPISFVMGTFGSNAIMQTYTYLEVPESDVKADKILARIEEVFVDKLWEDSING